LRLTAAPRKNPGHPRGDDKSNTGHQDYGSEDEHGNFCFGTGVAEHEQAAAEENEDDADLERGEDAGNGVGHTLLGLKADRDGRCFKEALAGFSAHVSGQFLCGAEFVD